MRTPVATIRNLLVVVSLIAVDCGLVHDCLVDETYLPFEGWSAAFRFGWFGSVLMANLVVIGGSMVYPGRGDDRPFLGGFVLAGAASILVIQGIVAVIPNPWCIPWFRAINFQAARVHPLLGLPSTALLDVSFVLGFGGPVFLAELLIATTSGLVARRLARTNPPIEPVASVAHPAS